MIRISQSSLEDIEAVIRLIAEVAGMKKPLAARRLELLHRVCRHINADAWDWAIADNVADGWRHALKSEASGRCNGRECNDAVFACLDPLPDPIFAGENDSPSHSLICCKKMSEGGAGTWSHHIYSFSRLSETKVSVFAFHRSAAAHPFTRSERAVAGLIFEQVGWLHGEVEACQPKRQSIAKLSPRQRRVLRHLLGGDSCKQVAGKMKLSEHTVAGYIKALHRHFGVRSRGELLSRFVGTT